MERPRRRAIDDVALSEITKFLVGLVANVLLRNGLVLAVGKPLEVSLDRGGILVAKCDDLHARNHRNAVNRTRTAATDAYEADAYLLAFEPSEGVVLHLSALAKAETVHLAAGDHGRSAHPSSSL